MKFKRVNFNLQEEKFWLFKQKCLRQKATMTDVLEGLIDYYLEAEDILK